MLKLRPALAKSIWLISARFVSSNTSHVATATTVDPLELEKFSRVAQIWWDPKGPYKALHTLNTIRVPFIVGNLTNHPDALENIKILDVGCGGGVLSEALAKCGITVTGIDAAKELIDVATRHCDTNRNLKIKPTYVCTTIEEHASKHQKHYDKIVASEVIEHVNNKELFVRACVQALKPGGRIYFTCPSKTRLSHLVNILFAENVMNNPMKGTHQYYKFVTPRDLGVMLESNGCNVEEIKGFALNMFTNTWKWTRNQSLFYATRAVRTK